MRITEILESVKFVIDKEGQQTAVQLDLVTWQALQELLEDLEDVAEFNEAQQEDDELFSWESVITEYQAKHALMSDVQD